MSRDWTTRQVADFVGSIGKGECWSKYAQLVLDEEIDGATFQQVTQEDLEGFGFKKLHAKSVIDARTTLPPPQSSPSLSSSSASSSASSQLPPSYGDYQQNHKNAVCLTHVEPFVAVAPDESLVCYKCLLSTHKGQHCDSLDEFFEKQMKSLTGLVEEGKAKVQGWENTIQTIDKVQQETNASFQRTESDIESYFASLEQAVKDRRQSLVDQLTKLKTETQQRLAQQRKQLESRKDVGSQSGTALQEALAAREPVRVLSLRLELKQALVGSESPEPVAATSIQFQGDEFVNRSIMEAGTLRDPAAFPGRCQSVGEGLSKVNPTKINQFTVVAFDSMGVRCKSGGEKFVGWVSFVHPLPARAEVAFQDQGDGSYLGQYQGMATQQATLHVTLRGDHIPGSPFKLLPLAALYSWENGSAKAKIAFSPMLTGTRLTSGEHKWSIRCDSIVSHYELGVVSGSFVKVFSGLCADGRVGVNLYAKGFKQGDVLSFHLNIALRTLAIYVNGTVVHTHYDLVTPVALAFSGGLGSAATIIDSRI